MTTHRTPHSRAITLAIIGTALVGLYALWAGIQILILNPLTAVPGKTLAQIQIDLAAAGETFAEAYVIGTLALGIVLAIVALITIIFWKDASPASAVVIYCGLLAAGALGYFGASFGPGMNLADTYMISGGDVSPWAIPLYIVSTLAVVVGIVALIAARPGNATSRGAQLVAG